MRWRHHSAALLDRVVVHPTEEQFIAVERVAAPTNASLPSTRVLVFQPHSSNPISVRTLPFQLRSVVAVPPIGVFPSESTGFTLVGITESWSVVVFGDDVQTPEEEGTSARTITQEAAPPKRTLFQDIFGDIGFADFSVPGPSKASTAVQQPWRGKEVTELFSAPAHLMPPLESIFDTVMDGFLASRSVEEEASEPKQDDGDEEMDVDETPDDADRPVRSTPLDRIVDRQEMSGFVELFAHHAIKGTIQFPSMIFGTQRELCSHIFQPSSTSQRLAQAERGPRACQRCSHPQGHPQAEWTCRGIYAESPGGFLRSVACESWQETEKISRLKSRCMVSLGERCTQPALLVV